MMSVNDLAGALTEALCNRPNATSGYLFGHGAIGAILSCFSPAGFDLTGKKSNCCPSTSNL
jgi:hypothetical protein